MQANLKLRGQTEPGDIFTCRCKLMEGKKFAFDDLNSSKFIIAMLCLLFIVTAFSIIVLGDVLLYTPDVCIVFIEVECSSNHKKNWHKLH